MKEHGFAFESTQCGTAIKIAEREGIVIILMGSYQKRVLQL